MAMQTITTGASSLFSANVFRLYTGLDFLLDSDFSQVASQRLVEIQIGTSVSGSAAGTTGIVFEFGTSATFVAQRANLSGDLLSQGSITVTNAGAGTVTLQIADALNPGTGVYRFARDDLTTEQRDWYDAMLSAQTDSTLTVLLSDEAISTAEIGYAAGVPSLAVSGRTFRDSIRAPVDYIAGTPSLSVRGSHVWSAAAAGDTFTIPAGINAIRVNSNDVSFQINRGGTRLLRRGFAARDNALFEVEPGDVFQIRQVRPGGFLRLNWYVRPDPILYAAGIPMFGVGFVDSPDDPHVYRAGVPSLTVIARQIVAPLEYRAGFPSLAVEGRERVGSEIEFRAGVPSLNVNFLERAGAVAFTAGVPSTAVSARAIPPEFRAGVPSMEVSGRLVLAPVEFRAGFPFITIQARTGAPPIRFQAGHPSMRATGRKVPPLFRAGVPSMSVAGRVNPKPVEYAAGIPGLRVSGRQLTPVTFAAGIPSMTAEGGILFPPVEYRAGIPSMEIAARVTGLAVTYAAGSPSITAAGIEVPPEFKAGFPSMTAGGREIVAPVEFAAGVPSLSVAGRQITQPIEYRAGFPSLAVSGRSRLLLDGEIGFTSGFPSLAVSGRQAWRAAATGDTFTIPAGTNALRIDSRRTNFRVTRGGTTVFSGSGRNQGTVHDVLPGDVLEITNFRGGAFFTVAWYSRPEPVEYAAGFPALSVGITQAPGDVPFTAGFPEVSAAARTVIAPLEFRAGIPVTEVAGGIFVEVAGPVDITALMEAMPDAAVAGGVTRVSARAATTRAVASGAVTHIRVTP